MKDYKCLRIQRKMQKGIKKVYTKSRIIDFFQMIQQQTQMKTIQIKGTLIFLDEKIQKKCKKNNNLNNLGTLLKQYNKPHKIKLIKNHNLR